MSNVTITVSGPVGSGKSALCKEIEILCRALGVPCVWEGGEEERNLVGGDSYNELAMYQPCVTLREALAQPGMVVVPSGGFYIACYKDRRSCGQVLWWAPDDRGYTPDLEQAGIYANPTPGYHDSEYNVPVPVWLIDRIRVRRIVDVGDSLNTELHSAAQLRAMIAAAQGEGK